MPMYKDNDTEALYFEIKDFLREHKPSDLMKVISDVLDHCEREEENDSNDTIRV